jgi:hypothetical protein
MSLAIGALQDGTISSQRKASSPFNIPRSTFQDRLTGGRSIKELHESQKRFTPEEEEAIKRFLYTLTR